MSASEPAVVTGVVEDADGNPVEGVTCILKRQSDNTVFETTTDAQGVYRFENLTQGVYHGMVRWEDGQGNLFNSKNKPFIDVGGLTAPDELVANFDATDLSLSNGDPVNTWPDTVGDFGDLQADPSRTPLYDDSGMGGNPTVEMSEDFFTVTTATEITQPYYMFAVYNNDDANSERFQILANTSGNQIEFQEDEGGSWLATDGTNTLQGGSPDSSNHIVVFGMDGGSSFIRADGTEVASGTMSAVSVDGSYRVGNNAFTRYADGSISHIEWFEGSLTNTEISTEETRLANKWGITL